MLIVTYPALGSSPRMRGTLGEPTVDQDDVGIIPAYAGNTPTPRLDRSGSGDHPRVCGEHVAEAADRTASGGSSPRMRGTPLPSVILLDERRIIPAYAGNTRRRRTHEGSNRDHPRVCGEHTMRPTRHRVRLGSSPRMRGTPYPSKLGSNRRGIIPAYAGNTFSSHYRSSIWPDHPRVCGEHRSEVDACVSEMGSSPRMRGTPA